MTTTFEYTLSGDRLHGRAKGGRLPQGKRCLPQSPSNGGGD